MAEYLKIAVLKFREHFNEMDENKKSLAQLNLTLSKPCQIHFFSLENSGQFMLVTFYQYKSDQIEVQETITQEPVSFLAEKLAKFERGLSVIQAILDKGRITSRSGWAALDDNASVYYFKDIKAMYPTPEEFSNHIIESVNHNIKRKMSFQKRNNEYNAIEEEVSTIKKDVRQIEDANLRTKMLESAKKIDHAILTVKTVEAHEQRLGNIEQEIGGVRKLIGISKEYQEFRILATDVDDLKKSHAKMFLKAR